MYKYIANLDDAAYRNFATSVSAAKAILTIGKDKFPLKGEYVILSKDIKGLLLLPAFSTEPIQHNRCLSNEIRKKVTEGILEIGCIYRLHVKCRFIVSPDSHYKRCENKCPEVQMKYPICRVGKPAEDCWEHFAERFGEWSYDNPECACWDFSEKDLLNVIELKTNESVLLTDLIGMSNG